MTLIKKGNTGGRAYEHFREHTEPYPTGGPRLKVGPRPYLQNYERPASVDGSASTTTHDPIIDHDLSDIEDAEDTPTAGNTQMSQQSLFGLSVVLFLFILFSVGTIGRYSDAMMFSLLIVGVPVLLLIWGFRSARQKETSEDGRP